MAFAIAPIPVACTRQTLFIISLCNSELMYVTSLAIGVLIRHTRCHLQGSTTLRSQYQSLTQPERSKRNHIPIRNLQQQDPLFQSFAVTTFIDTLGFYLLILNSSANRHTNRGRERQKSKTPSYRLGHPRGHVYQSFHRAMGGRYSQIP